MTEFLNMFLNPILTLLVGGVLLYHFTKLDGRMTRLEDTMSGIKEELAHGKVATNLFERHMATHSHKE